ncbi:MAG TPA: hypothetical protein VHR45_20295 [Thermoanaerobaculia bacterium]|nr:hypothetical protein [Thermoanaerobaculia bacterium]
MNHRNSFTMLFAAVLLAAAPALAIADGTAAPSDPQAGAMPANCPLHAEHMAAAKAGKATGAGAPDVPDHFAGVNARGDQAMGFSHTVTTHHFLLHTDGGEIRVEANAPEDTASRDQIRRHLFEIARSFTAGDFHTPMDVHVQIPPGVPTLERLRAAVTYSYSDTERGGRVELRTTNGEALQAIHEFLRFQIREHQTGDPLATPAR